MFLPLHFHPSIIRHNVDRLDALARTICGGAVLILGLLVAINAVGVPVGSVVGPAVICTILIVEGGTRRCILHRVFSIDRYLVEQS
ncbi:YgaP-like transmembrane domain [Halorubrum sp. AJ67]|uniref:YgaP-like transmembrane domain n=1 Tax=Halorubrum sp. AJ67 TaxID=1173487 RepID=UPI001E64FAC1|nr:YgaP-like transmembrane domain [Halorubrum sp. AJ67]